MTLEKTVIVVGAGAAGLAAADTLSLAGLRVVILEARDRIGGRVHTVRPQAANFPIELGAEFLHGKRISTWELVKAANLKTHEVPDRHFRQKDGKLESDSFWEKLDRVFQKIEDNGKNLDVYSFLEPKSELTPDEKKMAVNFVEGFHAADSHRMSIRALAKAEAASERDEATNQFRVTGGYSELLEWWVSKIVQQGATLHLETIVNTIRWKRGSVEVLAQTPEGTGQFHAARAIITLPLGVLQQRAVTFEPELAQKLPALKGLAMGSVAKFVLQFRSRFWPVANFGFIHSEDDFLPTWWADERGDVLTGWAGGPRAQPLQAKDPQDLVERSVARLSRIFKTDADVIRKNLVASHFHAWDRDPFAYGAYSYTTVGMTEMPAILAAPLSDTLFFAGEATDSEGEQGTVHGAITSGQRAAREILEASPH
jgi:monoamine oxidase